MLLSSDRFSLFCCNHGIAGNKSTGSESSNYLNSFYLVSPLKWIWCGRSNSSGNEVGKNNIVAAKKYGYETAKLATIYTLALSVVFIFFPHLLLMITTDEVSVIEQALPAIKLADCFRYFWCGGRFCLRVVRWVGKTYFVMGTEVITNLLIFVPASYFFGIFYRRRFKMCWGGSNSLYHPVLDFYVYKIL